MIPKNVLRLDIIKIKTFFFYEWHLKITKRQTIDDEKILAQVKSHKELGPTDYKNYWNSKIRERTNEKKWGKYLKRHFTKENICGKYVHEEVQYY